MVIEISPKRKFKISFFTFIEAGFCLILAILVLGSYFYFGFTIKKISQQIEEKELAASNIKQGIEQKEQEIIPIKEKIEEFNKLLLVHKNPFNVFAFLEKVSLPNVWFSNFSFDLAQKQVTLEGHTNSFATLEQQMRVLKQELILRESSLSNVAIEDEAGVSFTLLLIFNSDIFSFNFIPTE